MRRTLTKKEFEDYKKENQTFRSVIINLLLKELVDEKKPAPIIYKQKIR